MAHCPIVFSSQENLQVRSNAPGNERIQAVSADGSVSPYGCGWNVLFLLGQVTRDQAQAGVNHIAATHDERGEHTHPGLLISNSDNPHSIAGIITARSGLPNLTYCRFRWEEFDNDPARVRQAIIDNFFPRTAQSAPFYYVIIKYMINFVSGLGHTVLLSFERLPDGRYNVMVLDPQLKTFRPFDGTIQYLMAPSGTSGGRRYAGIAGLVQQTVGGKRKSKVRKSKRRKSRTKGGTNTLDPDMNPMSEHESEQYLDMIEDLMKWKPAYSTPFMYTPVHSKKNITIPI